MGRNELANCGLCQPSTSFDHEATVPSRAQKLATSPLNPHHQRKNEGQAISQNLSKQTLFEMELTQFMKNVLQLSWLSGNAHDQTPRRLWEGSGPECSQRQDVPNDNRPSR